MSGEPPPPPQPGWSPPPPPPAGYQYQQWPPGPPAWTPPVGPPRHPSARTAKLLGIAGLVGVLLCGLGTVVAPFAWWIGRRATSEIDADPSALGGRDDAQAGVVMGVIGTVLLALVIAYYALIVGIIAVG